MLLFYFSIVHLTFTQDLLSTMISSDCKPLLLPSRCQCYHSGEKSQLRCPNIQLQTIPKLTNNMHWNALDFSFNRLTSIDDYIFFDIYVEKLDFKYNSIELIETTAFDQIQNLKELFLDHNQLKTFHPNILISPGVSLEIFDLSFNPLTYLNLGEIFLHLKVVKQFHAVSCRLNNTSLYTLLNFTIHAYHSVELIDLSSNQLTSLCKNLFDSFVNLIELRLHHNQISAIDNYLIYSLIYLKNFNLAFNSMETVPNFFSSSLENLNLTSNKIRYLHDYFASNLRSIRFIDFDSNQYLSSISPRSLCFLNISTLEKLSFRSNNLTYSDAFSEFLCNDQYLARGILDLNHNINLKCDCMLVQFANYLIDYPELTCTLQGQDRYFVSKEAKLFSNCISTNCFEERRKNLCQRSNAERLILEGTCYLENQVTLMQTTTAWKFWENITENSTVFNQTSVGVMKQIDLMCFLFVFLSFQCEINKQ